MGQALKQKIRPEHHPDEFNLDVLTGDEHLFKWFLLAYLFGKPIQSSVAIHAWEVLLEYKLDTPWALEQINHRVLVQILDEGKYARYGETTARGLHACMEQLIREYEGSLIFMIESSENEDEFSKRLQSLHGVGPKVSEIIVRETEEFFARRIE